MIDEQYPHLAAWVRQQGWIEAGHDEVRASFIRVLDPGGMVWEGADIYLSLDEALGAAEEGIVAYMRQHGISFSL